MGKSIIFFFFCLEMRKSGLETKNKVRRTRGSASLVARNERFLERGIFWTSEESF